MTDDLDVDAMLEEPFKQQDKEKNGEEKSKKHDKDDKDKNKRKKSKERKRSASRSRSREQRSKSKDRKSRSRSRDRKGRHSDRDRRDKGKDREKDRKEREEKRREKEKEREKEREARRKEREKEKEKEREERKKRDEIERGRNVAKLDDYRSRKSSSKRDGESDLTPEERDLRTVFCMQLASRIRPRDLEEFFSAIGKVKDVRLILDNKSHRSKGIAYIEFKDIESTALAIGLSGQKLLGVPIIVQNAHAERNRQASTNQPASVTLAPGAPVVKPVAPDGPGRLYVGMLHPNISEDMLMGIFEPFGKVTDLKLVKDSSGSSAGYGFISYAMSEDAKKAMTQLDGFELAGKAIKVGFVTEKTGEPMSYTSTTPSQQQVAVTSPPNQAALSPATTTKSSGFNMGPSTRLHLMTKLAEGSDIKVPSVSSILSTDAAAAADPNVAPPPIATQCFILSNMFTPNDSSLGDSWQQDLRDEMIEECERFGGIVHLFIDSTSADGNIYMKASSIATAIAAVNALHGRFFAGRQVRAAYIPLPNYHTLFPDSIHVYASLKPSNQSS